MQNTVNRDSIFNSHWNDASEIEADYTRLSISALIAAVFGSASFLVFFTPWFSFVGGIAILLSLFALAAIYRADGILTGRSLAYFGLCTAIIALVSVGVFWASYQYGIRREADQFFRLWFAAVQKGDIPAAKEYLSIYSSRSEVKDAESWWKEQYADKYTHRSVHQYVEDKLVRVLMAIGDQAKISYYTSESIISEREADTITSIYAVSFPGESEKTQTFFVKITGKRIYPAKSTNFQAAGWRLDAAPSFILPEEFKK